MELIKLNCDSVINIDEKIVVGLGQFDGLHRGHLKLIEEVKKFAKERNYKSGIVTFDPHPDFILGKRQNDGYITPLPEKIKILEDLHIDYLFLIHFDIPLSQMAPDEFFQKFLSPFAGIVIGSDYCYGYKGQGNAKTLQASGKDVIVVDLLEYENEKIGSNKIRDLLTRGEVNKIYQLLNRYYHITGVVSHGSQVGRILGFRTANVELSEQYQILKKGVYAVYVKINGHKFLGVCNIGNNPSVNFVERMRLEVHILDFDQNIYGQEIEIEFLERIRDEMKISKDDLIKQINQDIDYVRSRYQL
ncbi:MAG TPA: riboflavin biosynthesis protein RibF [Bacilli bacterium]